MREREKTQTGATIDLMKTMRDQGLGQWVLRSAPETKPKDAVTSFKKVGAEKAQLTSQLQQAAELVKQINTENFVAQILQNNVSKIGSS